MTRPALDTNILDDFVTLCKTAKVEPLPVDSLGRSSQADILRLDQVHPVLSGNKLFKLLDHLAPILTAFEKTDGLALVSPGGPWSNHLHALAAFGRELGIATHGLVRGYEHLPLTDTLSDCVVMGMKLHFLNKKEYSQRYEPAWQEFWAEKLNAYWIGEGGSIGGEKPAKPAGFARPGMDLLASLVADYDEIWMAVGSGTTAEGLRSVLSDSKTVVGVNCVQDQDDLAQKWDSLFPNNLMRLIQKSEFGTFGRPPEQALNIVRYYEEHGLPLDPIYGARLLWAWEQFGPQAKGKCLLIHGGGLQGRRGFGLSWNSAGFSM